MKILVADDHPLIRHAIRAMVEQMDGFEVVGEAADVPEAIKLLAERKPELLVLDLDMPGGTAESLAEQGLKLLPNLKILILTAHNDDKFLRRFSKIRISGYILKDEGAESLKQALRTVSQGATWFSHSIIQRLMSLNAQPEAGPELTAREKMIVILIGEGKDNMAIADQLGLAEQTVRNYCSTIYSKLGLESRVAAVLWAREHGFVQEPA